MFTNYIYGQGDFQTRDIILTGIIILCMDITFMTLSMVVYTVYVTCQDIDGGATELKVGPVPQCSYATVCFHWPM